MLIPATILTDDGTEKVRKYAFKVRGCLFVFTNVPIYLQNGLTDLYAGFGLSGMFSI
jgi:hypothetical protein